MKRPIRITVAEPSVILRGGIISVLKQTNAIHAEVFELGEIDRLTDVLRWQRPDILLINPGLLGVSSLSRLRKETANPEMKCVALSFSLLDASVLKEYDGTISLYDTAEQIAEKITRLVQEPAAEKRPESLSQREKEVVVEVIRGLTNKQIADKLCLSTHTIITHRRNIAAKLGIHSSAGLTIYAIVNKLVDLDELKMEG
ncbi:MAG: response regulator transcription factor [Rikenellaceae bacterium]|jgi:DNA-binding NarL/FixJ family response regulator|nr:response regulator transcription factor [Rikenellaceae bacterium]